MPDVLYGHFVRSCCSMFHLFADRADLDFIRVIADVISRSSGCDCCSHWKHTLRLLRSGVSFEGHRFVFELSVYVMVFDCLLSLAELIFGFLFVEAAPVRAVRWSTISTGGVGGVGRVW